MKQLIFGLTCFISAAGAATITNFGTAVPQVSEGNTLTTSNVPTWPAEAWHSPLGTSQWESIQPNTLNPPIPNGTLVDFYFIFDVPGSPTAGSLGILVDDSARGVLNGHVLFDNIGLPLGPNCSASLPSCVVPYYLDITSDLVSQRNRLDIWVQQDGNYTYGLDVYGKVISVPEKRDGSTPEPGGPWLIAVVGFGLIAVGKMHARR